jgi:uncharacterized repeat protein (TIGR03803 family)
MSHSRALALLLATISLLAGPLAHAQIGIEPIPDQNIPSGKTLVVPIAAADTSGSSRSYTVTTGSTTVTGTTPAGITAVVRTGDPHLIVNVTYTDSNSAMQTGTMDFQLLREFSPITTEIIAGLTQGGYYSPQISASGTTYILFNRVVAGFVVQLGGVSGDGRGGPGFTFENEFNPALIFSGTLGQLSMANGGTDVNGGTNGSQYFITLGPTRSLDFQHTVFGQLIRYPETLNGVAGTPIDPSKPVDVGGNPEFSTPLNPVDITSATVVPNNTDAVLLLSATGLCNVPVTVTALTYNGSTLTGSTSQTFTAHAVDDTANDDPPFLQPVANTIAPNGNLKLALSGTDLQLDLLRYGYQQLLPAADSSITSGTSPLLTIPLISNTDNTIAAVVDHWNASTRGFDSRIFHVGAGDKPITGSLATIPVGTFSALTVPSSSSVPLVVFTTANASDTATSFTRSVNWGNGTLLSGSQVTIVKAGSQYKLFATGTYTTPGEYPVLVKISDPGGAYLTLTGTANIGASAIGISGADIVHTGGALSSAIVATFKDVGTGVTASDYVATINWGDGAVSTGSLVSIGGGSFRVLGSHVYKTPAAFTICTSVARTGLNGYSASTWTTAHISGVTAPQVFPPFSQAHLAQIWSIVYSDSNVIMSTGTNSGGNPFAGLFQAADGNFYGTTRNGGADGLGTIFQITASGSLTTLYSFTGGNDGGNPVAALTGTGDTLYGTAETDGSDGFGTVFSITTGGSFTALYSFTGANDGANPVAGLVTGTDGNLYGTTENKGVDGFGTIFKITTSGSLTTIHPFTGGSDGDQPEAALITGSAGNFYGTTETEGSGGFGTVFSVTYSGLLTTLYSFTGGNDGGNPVASVVTGTDGNLYGTTENKGSGGSGTIFEVPITTSGSLKTLYSFTGAGDGGNPVAGLATGTDGNLYGTTENGGAAGFGVLFDIPYGGTATNTLYSFTGSNDGSTPLAPLVMGTGGGFYGTTETGGSNAFGTVFQFTPGSTSPDTLFAFTSGTGFQISLRAAVAIVNSGNKPSTTGTFSAFVDPNGTIDGQQTYFASDGQTSFIIPPLLPGQNHIFTFYLQGSVVDSRLKLPVNFDPTGEQIGGVVNYNDPVGNFDGSQKIISLGKGNF